MITATDYPEVMVDRTATSASTTWHDIHGPVHVRSFGGDLSGSPVILIHGLGGSYANWSLLAPELQGIGPVTAIDLPGFGKSEPGDRRATIEENTAVVVRFLETLGRPAVVVGNSMGGLISILAASQRPDLVSRLVLLGPALPIANLPVTKLPALWAEGVLVGYGFLASPLVRKLDLRLRVKIMLSFCGIDVDRLPPEHIDRAVTLISERQDIEGMDRALVVAARSLVSILGNPSAYWKALRSIQCPVLLLHGDKDRLVPVGNARNAARKLPHWRYIEYRDSGHLLQLEHPEAVGFEIDSWLEELS